MGNREQEGRVGKEQGAIWQDFLEEAICGGHGAPGLLEAGWRGRLGRREKAWLASHPLAFLSLQPAGTSLHRSQCLQGVKMPDWR